MTGVKAVLLLLISVGLWSGIQAGLQRKFSTETVQSLNWAQAQEFCVNQGSTLATILDSGQKSEAAGTFSWGRAWIGLRRPWSWSLYGETEPLSGWNLQWDRNEPQAQNCTALKTDTRKFVAQDCARQLQYTACYRESDQKHFVVSGSRTWIQARDFCRSNYTDLSSVWDLNQTQQVLQAFHSQTPPTTTTTTTTTTETTKAEAATAATAASDTTTTAASSFITAAASPDPALVWIGLNRRRWVWSDLSPVSWSSWGPGSFSVSGPDCVVMETDGTWTQEDCSNGHHVVCHKDVPVVLRTSVKLLLKPGSADLDDPVVQQSLLNQMSERLQGAGGSGVRLTWGQCKKQPSRTAPSADCGLDLH